MWFPFIHDLTLLGELVEAHGGEATPVDALTLAGLTSFGAQLRYSTADAAVALDPRRAIDVAAEVLVWAEGVLAGP